MIFEIIITDHAEADLRSILYYIAFDLKSPENAEGQLHRLEEAILSFESMPERFREYDRDPWKSRRLHIMAVDNYCVFYTIDKLKMTVTIIRVMYGAMDFDTQF